MISPASVAQVDISVFAPKASAAQCDLPVQTGGRILWRGDLHYAAELAPVFSGITRRAHTHGIGFFRLKRGGEGGRPVLRKRQSIDHELHLIFRFAWVQRSIGFKEPAWKRIDQIEQTASRL